MAKKDHSGFSRTCSDPQFATSRRGRQQVDKLLQASGFLARDESDCRAWNRRPRGAVCFRSQWTTYWQRCRTPSGPLKVVPGRQTIPLRVA
jgi:hypothetical protein